jgi:hypothetical protein
MLQRWHDFFNMTGTAGATLIGLLFVVITLGTRLSAPHSIDGIRAFVTPTLVHFGGVLFLALVVLAPWPSAWLIGVILVLQGVSGLAYQIQVIRVRYRLDFVTLHPLDWIPYAAAPVLANASLLGGGAGVLADAPFAPYALAGASTLLLAIGIYGSWDLALWIIKNRNTP